MNVRSLSSVCALRKFFQLPSVIEEILIAETYHSAVDLYMGNTDMRLYYGHQMGTWIEFGMIAVGQN